MEWTNCQKLPKNGTQNIPNTYKNNPKLFATEIFEISSKIYSKTLFLTGNWSAVEDALTFALSLIVLSLTY